MRIVNKEILKIIETTTESIHNVFHFDCPDCYPLLKKHSTDFKYHLMKKMDIQMDIDLANQDCLTESSLLQNQMNKYKRKSLIKLTVPKNSTKTVGNLIKSKNLKTKEDFQYYEKVINNTFNLRITRESINENDIGQHMKSDKEVFFDFINDEGKVYTMSSFRICKIFLYPGEKLLIDEKLEKTSNEFKRFHFKLKIEDNTYYIQQSLKKYNKYFLNKGDWVWLNMKEEKIDESQRSLPEDYYILYDKYHKSNKIPWSIVPHDFLHIQENYGQDIYLKNSKL